MTAYRYYRKYKKTLFDSKGTAQEVDAAIKAIFCEFIDEGVAIGEAKNIILWSQLLTILKDQNTKWNRVIKYGTDHYGYSPLKWNCILDFSKNYCSELQNAAKGVFK